jgi:hypothetical protein
MWTADPRNAALYDAGIDDVFIRAANTNRSIPWQGEGALIDLSLHLASIPSGAIPVSLERLRSSAGCRAWPIDANLDLAVALGDAAERLAPTRPLAVLAFSNDPRGDAVLGVAAATVAELADNPDWLAETAPQRFVDAYFARLLVMRPGARDELSRLRPLLSGGPGFIHGAALEAATDAIAPLLGSGKPHSAGILSGSMTAQLVYNAAILRDPAMGRAALGIVAESAPLEAGVPGWAAARAQAAGVDPTDWSAQFHYGLHLVDLIVKGSPP